MARFPRFRSLALLCALAFPAVARAGDEMQILPRTGIEARVSSPWPEQLNKGWAPIRVELVNKPERARKVRVRATCEDWMVSRHISQDVELEPGERVELELLAPAGGQFGQPWTLVLQSGDDEVYFSNAASGGGEPSYLNVLTTSREDLARSAVESWQERTSKSLVGGGWAPPGSAPPKPNDVQIGHATHTALPRNASAYTSLDLVVVDAAAELPPDDRLEPLLAWARNGGQVLFAGQAGLELARARGAIAPWLEERFERPGVARHFLCGLGAIHFIAADGWFESEAVRELVYDLADSEADAAPRQASTSRTASTSPAIPGLGEIPYRVFALLLLGFAVLIGPVNFVWIRKRKRPVLLLLTIPVIAIGTSLALLAYGVLVQGLDVKANSLSVAVLDERLHRSASIERRVVFAGLAPGEGLRPDPGTSVHAVTGTGMAGVFRERLRLEIERSPELLLASDYIPTRVQVQQVLLSERAARARLEIERKGERLAVTNSLGTRIDGLVARDAAGNWYRYEGPLEPGVTVELEPAGPDALGSLLDEPYEVTGDELFPTASEGLPAGCYAARLARSPFVDDCGIEMTRFDGQHTLLGVWGLDLEVWR